MFKKKFTKWIPLGRYSHGYTENIVFVRKNLKTGMMKFKVRRVNRLMHNDTFVPRDLIDIKKAWEEIITK